MMAVFVAVAAAVALLAALMLAEGTARAQTDATPTQVVSGPVVVWETAIPEDWPSDQASHIMSFEAYSADESALTFALKEADDTAKFSLIPAGVNDDGNYVAHLTLNEGEALDYDSQDSYLIGALVSTSAGATTEFLLRLKITAVDEDVPPPTPTASVTPSATPTDPCFEAISGEVNIVKSWNDLCLSENRPNDQTQGDYYARFFAFTLEEAAAVSISLTSEIDTYLYLMKGWERDGEIVAENDDIIQYINFNSGINDLALDAGIYTVEATAYAVEKSGNFRLVVSGLPDTGEPQSDCATGGAALNAEENAGLVADCETLLGLRDALAGTTLLNWAAALSIEDWDGVTVGGSPVRVTELALDDSGLSGTIPAELGMLDGLEVLSLSGNGLKGAVPDELSSLHNLTELSLDGNQLTGAIPLELGELSNLETLALSENRLSGAIPVELVSLPGLKSLLLADNRLTGEIPVELSDLTDLEELKLAGNSLSGCIPPALQDVTDNDLALTGLDTCASGVCATGNAVPNPDENAGLVSDCNALLAARDRLAGRTSLNWSVDVPIESWEGVEVGGSPRRVIHLVLNQRGLSGRLPAQLGRLSRLSLLQLSGNDLTGTIPVEIGNLSSMHLLILAENNLSGEIPPALADLSNLSHLTLSGNDLSGEIPPELSGLTKLGAFYADNNRLSGQIPGELGSLPALRFLSLDNNRLSGEIPSGLGESASLERLSLSGNRLTGSIPPDLGSISSLEELSLDDNMLEGTIPPELGSLSNLEILSLSENRLGGEIPAQLGAIPNLGRLFLHTNGFTGCISKELEDVPRNDLIALGLEFCGEGKCAGGTAVENPNDNHGLVSDCNGLLAALEKLNGGAALNWSTEMAIESWDGVVIGGSPRRITELDLSDEELDGMIAPELGILTNLRTLNLSNNRLTGEIPSELARLSNLEALLLSNNRLNGQIPHDLARLGSLTELRLAENSLTGCIPDGLVDIQDNDLDIFDNLPACEEVDCSSGFAVEKPGDNEALVADCETLIELRDALAGNAFLNWSVHRALDEWDGVTVSSGSTKNVSKIELNDLGLDGVIPPGISDMTGLEELALSGNNLRGEIPSELRNLTSLRRLLLDGNQLSGEISPELAVLKNLEEIKLSGNNLSGCMPEAFEDVATSDLDELGLEFCETGECSTGTAVDNPNENPGLVADCAALLAARDTLKGAGFLNWSADVSIEEWYGVTVGGSPKRVTQLKIEPSRVDGEIAPELGRLSDLEVLSLADNRLSGAIPPELGNLFKLEELSLSSNRLSGEIPSELGKLTALDHMLLSDNRLSGRIPSALGSLNSVNYLSLSNNRLTGGIPSEFGNLTNLRYLRLSDNELTGEMPAELGSLSNLAHLHLSGNELSGVIPAELGLLANLRLLNLSDNNLTGEIPSELGSLSSLTELRLSRNALTGEIPSELGSLSNLERLYLTRNLLTGEIPPEFVSLTALTHLFLVGNELTGCIPDGLNDVQDNDLSLLNLPDC